MKYEIVDFRHLVSCWYNKFLPERCVDQIKYVEHAGIAYLDSVPLDTSGFKRDSIQFMLGEMLKIHGGDFGKTCVFVQEPKPVNNVRLNNMLKMVETSGSIDYERKLKVLHIANRRYVPISRYVLLHQERELDKFLDGMFNCLLDETHLPGLRFVSSPSLDLVEIRNTMEDFFPKSALSWHRQDDGDELQIVVKSSNEILQQLFCHLMGGVGGIELDSGTSRYLDRCRKSMIESLEKVV